MQTLVAIFIGKLIAKLTRALNFGGGSASPGLYALKLDPDLVTKLAKRIPKNIIITGTNGKTTTSRLLTHFAKELGLKVIRNHTGSNLERGIASALISNYQLQTTNYQLDLGIWELDEAAFNTVAPKLNPDIVVFLNVFRDQLDRYGEVDSVVKRWGETLKILPPKTLMLVNGDDANTAQLKSFFKGNVYTFGVEDYKIVGESLEKKASQKKLDFEARDIELKGLSGSSFSLHTSSILHPTSHITLPLPGVYHIYDFLAAFYAGHELGFSTKSMISSLKGFQPAFGRVEKLPFGYIFLIKNPAGATQVFETLAPQLKPNDRLLIALNDNLADGTDVSWIWDAGWERLHTGYKLQVICSGIRAYDLANRLKYAGFEPDHLQDTSVPSAKLSFKAILKRLELA